MGQQPQFVPFNQIQSASNSFNKEENDRQNEKYKQQKKAPMIDPNAPRDESKFDYTYRYDLGYPESVEDFHWLCFFHRSNDKYSCMFGIECRWRHYNFDRRCDMVTAWNVSMTNDPSLKPKVSELTDARKLKKSLQSLYPWLCKSNNPFIGNPTPPSVQKRRAKIHANNAKKRDEEESKHLKVRSRRKLIEEMEEVDEKQKIDKDECKDIEEEQSQNAEEYQLEVVGDENVTDIGLGELETGMSMMKTFTDPKNENVDYYMIGKLAYQSFAVLKQKLIKKNQEK